MQADPHHRLRSLIVLLVPLALVACGADATPTPTPTPRPTATRTPTPISTPTPTRTPTPVSADVEVLVRVSRSPLAPEGELQVDVLITPKNVAVSGVQIVLGFDLSLLEAVEIIPGPFLGLSPVLLQSEISKAHGLVMFTAARRGPTPEPGQPGILLTARFQQRVPGGIPRPAIRVQTLELTSADFEFIRRVDLVIE